MAVPSFLNKNGSRDFLDKQKNLFDVLNSAEKEKRTTSTHNEFIEEVEHKSNKRKRKETKQFKGKESLFKEPVDLPLRFRKTNRLPDFQKNPHKWTKYSLADVTLDEMSNESNTAAALAFLKQIKIQKKQSPVKMEVTESEKKSNPATVHQFTFHQKKEDSDKCSEKPVFKSSKLIMPEYVVGQSKKATKVSKKKMSGEKNQEKVSIYLNHIHEYDDE